jgi:dCTP deaminase
VITPLIDPCNQIGPSSIDVRLGSSFKVPMTSQTGAIEPWNRDLVRRYLRSVEVGFGGQFYLHPSEFVLASTLEFIRVPPDLACRIEGRSSWGRLGLLVHATAGFVDPGYSGSVTFELLNAGKLPIVLRPGMRMAQLCFLHLDGNPCRPYDKRPGSKYNKSLSPEGSRIWEDL